MPELPYYLTHFETLLQDVSLRSADLLNDDEQAFVTQFHALSVPSRALLVRLLGRRHTVFEAATLKGDAFPDVAEALAPLVARGWVQADAPITVDEVMTLVTQPRLMAALGGLRVARKAALRDALWATRAGANASGPDARLPLSVWLGRPEAAALRLTIQPVVDRLRFLFFGNLYQDASTFVVAELGHVRYESVPFTPTSRGFVTRADVEVAWQLAQWRALLTRSVSRETLWAVAAACLQMRGPWSAPTQARWHRFRYQWGRAAERAGEETLAFTLYHGCDDPRAAERLRVMRKRWRLLPPMPRVRAALRVPPEEPVVLDQSPAICVELSVAEALTTPEVSVHYVENTLFTTVFGLLFWPVMFAPVPGAFFNAYQAGPADLYRPGFAEARQPLLAAAWAQLDAPDWIEVLLARWEDKRGTQNPWVTWRYVSASLLRTAMTCIPVAHWKVIFTRLWQDLKAHRSGFPDLIALNPSAGSYRLLEVKAPGDRLQDHQARWMDVFLQHGIPCAVVPVHWHE